MSLAQGGARVLVHGAAHDSGRVTSAEIFHDLGLPPAAGVSDVECAWARREPAFVGTGFLCPPLQRLLDVRAVVGLRNAGHTVAKMINPVAGARVLRLVNHTHPEFGALMGAWAQRSGADAMLLRGTEGEPVADPRRLPRLETWLAGQLREDLSAPAQEGVLTALPVLPREHEAATTAVYIQSVLSGEQPAPVPLARQVALLMAALDEIDAPIQAPTSRPDPH
jgi:anthranilate phosphoribosyltransferase